MFLVELLHRFYRSIERYLQVRYPLSSQLRKAPERLDRYGYVRTPQPFHTTALIARAPRDSASSCGDLVLLIGWG